MKIEKDMIMQSLHVHAGRVQEKDKEERGGECFFRNYHLIITLLRPLEVKNKITCLEKKSLHLYSL